MPDVIILTEGQAEQVRGPSAVDPNHVLLPIALTDGTYILGPEVLIDPAHAQYRSLLAALPLVDYDSVKDKLPPEPQPEEPAP